MGITVLLFLVFYLVTRNCGFYTYIVFFPALFYCMKDMSEEKKTEPKWAAFWFLFAFLQVLPSFLDRSIYYSLAKCAACVYFAFFNDCSIIIDGFKKGYEQLVKVWELYLEKCCKKCEKQE